MSFASTGIKDKCFDRGGKKVCTEKQAPSSIDFDNAISNLPDAAGVSTTFWLDKGEYDKNNCYRSDATGSCDIPEDLEDIKFDISESKDNSMISKYVAFQDEDFEKNTHKRTTVSLSGNYDDFGGDTYSLNMTLKLNEESQTMSDAKYRDKKNDYLTRIDYHGGVVPPTPYDDADNRDIYVKEHGVTIKGNFHEGNNK